MALGTLGTIALIGGGLYLGNQYLEEKKKKKKKKKKNGNGSGNGGSGGNGNGGADVPEPNGDVNVPPSPDTDLDLLNYVVFLDPANCTDWYVPAMWSAQIATPIVVTAYEAAGGDPSAVQYVELTHKLLDGELPEGCAVPPGDPFTLQADVPNSPDYFENEAILGLYQHVAQEVQSAITRAATNDELPVMFPAELG